MHGRDGGRVHHHGHESVGRHAALAQLDRIGAVRHQHRCHHRVRMRLQQGRAKSREEGSFGRAHPRVHRSCQALHGHAAVVDAGLDAALELVRIHARQQPAIERRFRNRWNHVRLHRRSDAGLKRRQGNGVSLNRAGKFVRCERASSGLQHFRDYGILFIRIGRLHGLANRVQQNQVRVIDDGLRAVARGSLGAKPQPQHLLFSHRDAENQLARRE